MTSFPKTSLRAALHRFRRAEDGTATILFLFFALIFIVMGGLAIDFNKAMQERTNLQVTADTAAHAALYTRQNVSDPADARNQALDAVNGMLRNDVYGAALVASDIDFGTWDQDTLTFTVDQNSRTAVRVQPDMTSERGNASRNLLLRIIGQSTFDLRRRSIYSTYFPPCFNEGFVAEQVVDIQSNNAYFDGFCLHSNTYVSLNSNNFFEPGTVVSMPDTNDLDLPNSGFETNEGLQLALRNGAYHLRLLKVLPEIINSLYAGNLDVLENYSSKFQPVGFTEAAPTTLTPKSGKLSVADFNQGPTFYKADCSKGKSSVTIETGTYENVVFVTNCTINFQNGVVLEESIFATTNTAIKSVVASHVRMGADDNCAAGGGALIMTLGGFEAASSLQGYGAQILAVKDIQFAANADGIEGVSFQSLGRIDGTSNMNMGFCEGEGTEDFLKAPYFRMVD
ncbi:TadE/TadG family type IV pilus assembly protein [Sulfitobacter sp. D35]|uniref:TadE/TadG family type IV pilus assembly protein n=1 Tax=Sulfitobacter sp. D35 TaxID=3083252 RepID=UPI00296F7877|nr:TadE/TadG family type IV pilus assembly protein [Sulfitobacter sp. D35]MDW4497019.1 TadE/TadG family type IV pilus assembly protein [Sulfitobacter sp. D35]